VLDLAELMYIC